VEETVSRMNELMDRTDGTACAPRQCAGKERVASAFADDVVSCTVTYGVSGAQVTPFWVPVSHGGGWGWTGGAACRNSTPIGQKNARVNAP
jgi:hypothetical protein